MENATRAREILFRCLPLKKGSNLLGVVADLSLQFIQGVKTPLFPDESVEIYSQFLPVEVLVEVEKVHLQEGALFLQRAYCGAQTEVGDTGDRTAVLQPDFDCHYSEGRCHFVFGDGQVGGRKAYRAAPTVAGPRKKCGGRLPAVLRTSRAGPR